MILGDCQELCAVLVVFLRPWRSPPSRPLERCTCQHVFVCPDFTRRNLDGLYRNMCQVRAFELGLEGEFKRGNVPGMLHVGLGQEAVQAAIAANLNPTDCFFPDHRCHVLEV